MNTNDIPLGVRHGMPFADYLAVRALSASGMKLLDRSPAHYRAGQNPNGKKSDALRRGSLLHTMVLEPAEVLSRYIVKPEGLNFATKEGKAWRSAVPEGVEVISADEYATANSQRDSLKALPEVAALLGSGSAEVSFFWLDEATGVLCKGRADWVFRSPAGVILLDLNTTEDASPAGFGRACARYGYHRQAAWYSDGWRKASGDNVLGFVFGAVENDWPNAACAYMLDDEATDKARADCRRLVQLLADCTESNRWPGYADSIQTITLPAWA